MGDITYEKLRKRISEDLNPRAKEFGKMVEDIGRNFRALGLETAVWLPDKIHTANLGGIDADSYLGYSRVEGRWGLVIRTIERDHENHAFMDQRVIAIESCCNMELVASALKRVRDLVLLIREAVERQIKAIAQPGREITDLRNPQCTF